VAEHPFAPAAAMELIAAQERRTRTSFDGHLDQVLAAWGVAWLFGLGALWFQVRGQSPYAGPQGWAPIVFASLLAAAASLTAWRTVQTTRGVGGDSGYRGMLYGYGWLLGFAAYFGIMGALAGAGASPAVLGVFGVVGPLLVTGLQYLVGAAILGARPMAALGGWLIVLAASIGFAGPVTALVLGAVLGGGGFLATAAWVTLRRRRRG